MPKYLEEIHPGEILLEEYDIRVATRKLSAKLTPRIRVLRAAAA